MKKIVFLVAMLALSLAGCGREESAENGTPATPEQQSAPAQAPAESGEAAPADGAAVEGEAAPAEDTAPVEGDTAPADDEAAPAPAEDVQGQ